MPQSNECYVQSRLEIIVEDMSGPKDPTVRPPAVAGQFYPSDPQQCRADALSFLQSHSTTLAQYFGKGPRENPVPMSTPPENNAAATSPQRWIGGIVPHAGWICSGAVAGATISTLAAASGPLDVVVVFGAVHTPIYTQSGALDSHQRWAVPGGVSQLPADLARRLQERGNLFVVDDRLHTHEHAVEVNLPLIQLAFPNVSVLPIEIPAMDAAALMGRTTALAATEAGLRAVFLASSDFTHYGPSFRFAPAGLGPAGIQWAMDNDRRLLELIQNNEVDRVVPDAEEHASACGAGAIAAMLAACREFGARTAQVLRHTNSFETLADVAPQPPTNAVGYAAVVVGH